MTHLFSTSEIYSPIGNSEKCKKSLHSSNPINTYMVEITDYEGETYTLEVEAKSYSQASAKASSIFPGDIYNMNIYKF